MPGHIKDSSTAPGHGYGEYRDEIDREIELNEAEYERGRAAAAAGEQALRS